MMKLERVVLFQRCIWLCKTMVNIQILKDPQYLLNFLKHFLIHIYGIIFIHRNMWITAQQLKNPNFGIKVIEMEAK